MNCLDLYRNYQNQVVEVEFKNSTQSFKSYGASVVGFLYYPIGNGAPFYEDIIVSNSETLKYQLVRLCFRITAGCKIRNQISDELEKRLIEEGFGCQDVLRITSANEVSLSVTGNTSSFLKNKNEIYSSYSVTGVWTLDQQSSSLKFAKDGIITKKMSGLEFYSLCNNIRGCNYDEIEKKLGEYNLNFNLKDAPIQELDLIKALCNVFIWLEYYFVESSVSLDSNYLTENQNSLPKFFDEFIVDYTSHSGKQKDIYLLKKDYQNFTKKNLLDELVSKSLLSRIKVKIRRETFENYFVPFTKSNFDRESQLNSELNSVYNSILIERDMCLRKHFNTL